MTAELTRVYLTAEGAAVYYLVSGEVVNSASPSVGLVDATVVAEVNGTPAFTTTTGPTGQFGFEVLFGTYELVAASQGITQAAQPLYVDGPVARLVFALPEMTYLFSGTITDGLSGTPLAGATISDGGTLLGVTDSSGLVTFPLANGTHELTAGDPAAIAIQYAPVVFEAVVAGGTCRSRPPARPTQRSGPRNGHRCLLGASGWSVLR